MVLYFDFTVLFRLEYRYMKLIESNTGKDGAIELPNAESCALQVYNNWFEIDRCLHSTDALYYSHHFWSMLIFRKARMMKRRRWSFPRVPRRITRSRAKVAVYSSRLHRQIDIDNCPMRISCSIKAPIAKMNKCLLFLAHSAATNGEGGSIWVCSSSTVSKFVSSQLYLISIQHSCLLVFVVISLYLLLYCYYGQCFNFTFFVTALYNWRPIDAPSDP